MGHLNPSTAAKRGRLQAERNALNTALALVESEIKKIDGRIREVLPPGIPVTVNNVYILPSLISGYDRIDSKRAKAKFGSDLDDCLVPVESSVRLLVKPPTILKVQGFEAVTA